VKDFGGVERERERERERVMILHNNNTQLLVKKLTT
jgi:hypothetical protein